MKSLAIINNKGGTAKTTTSVTIAAGIANAGKKVLLVDLDSQSSASLSLGLSQKKIKHSAADLLFDNLPPQKVITPTAINGLDLICGDMQLANTDIILADHPGRELQIKQHISTLTNKYDNVIFDCPPSLSLLSVNALVASEFYLVPLTPDFLSFEGLLKLIETVNILEKNMGINAKLLGILFTIVTTSIRMSQEYKTALEVISTVREQFGEHVFNRIIRKDVAITQAPATGKTIFDYDPKCRGAKEYQLLINEIEQRWSKN